MDTANWRPCETALYPSKLDSSYPQHYAMNGYLLPPHSQAPHHHDYNYAAAYPPHPMTGYQSSPESALPHHMSGQSTHISSNMFTDPSVFAASLGLPMQGYQDCPSSSPTKRKRRRVVTPVQRSAANVRERKRMYNLNEAFDLLRKKVPTFAYEKRLSRIETLRLAITYISFLTDVMDGKDPDDVSLPKPGPSTLNNIQRLFAQSDTRQHIDAGDDSSTGSMSPTREVEFNVM